MDLSEFGLTDEELFAPFPMDEQEAERITAPKYSYWQSVFRVFFKKKINLFALLLLAVMLKKSRQIIALLAEFADR